MNQVWIALGIVGQTIFSARFVLQWLYSEKQRRSAIPMSFWYASLLGAGMLLAYSIHLRDPVFILGQSGGLLIYVRNIQLRQREARARSVQ